jgi:phosphoribosylformylglycinamidine cyclo-ligase
MQEVGGVAERDMYNAFNMGIGMVLAVPPEIVSEVVSAAESLGEKAYVIGEVAQGQEKIEIC